MIDELIRGDCVIGVVVNGPFCKIICQIHTLINMLWINGAENSMFFGKGITFGSITVDG